MIGLKNQINLCSNTELTKKIGRSTAQFVYQLHYWIEKKQGIMMKNTRWIYNTAIEWAKQIGISSRQIERIIKKLKSLNLIKVEHFGRTNRVNYITINYDVLSQLFNEQKTDKMSETKRQNVGMNNKETKNNNKEKYKSDETAYETISSLVVQSSDSQQVKKNILNEEKKIKAPEKTIEHNTNALNLKKTKKPTIVQDMISMWNNRIKKTQMTPNKDISRNLVAAFKHKFNSDLKQWDHYLKRIESSSYLMSQDFKLSLYWALKYQIIDRIEQGEFGVKEIQRTVSQDVLNKKLEEHFETLNESEKCKDIRRKIAKVIGLPAYLSWFTKVIFVINDRGIQFKAQNLFVNDYISTHYGYLLS